MVTKYKTLNKETRDKKKTIFTKFVNSDLEIVEVSTAPETWGNVLHIGFDRRYGDVFKVWDDNSERDFVIVFGEKGDEFDN